MPGYHLNDSPRSLVSVSAFIKCVCRRFLQTNILLSRQCINYDRIEDFTIVVVIVLRCFHFKELASLTPFFSPLQAELL